MPSSKVRSGVSFEDELSAKLARIVEDNADLQTDKSEVVNAILDEYLKSNTKAELRQAIVRRRLGRRR